MGKDFHPFRMPEMVEVSEIAGSWRNIAISLIGCKLSDHARFNDTRTVSEYH